MPVVLYTNERFDVGSVFDTRDYCGLNRRALEEATDDERAVEAFLEEVRQEHFPDAPDRLCAVVGIPIPERESRVLREEGWGFTDMPAPEPAGTGVRCYHIREVPGAEHRMADEAFVGTLVGRWPEIRDGFEKWRLAESYWTGAVLRGYSVLIRGPVRVEAECRWPRGGPRLTPVVWRAD